MYQNQRDLTKFEFLLTLEGNIIIQRFFNVPEYNPASKRSLDLAEIVQFICEKISRKLKSKSSEYSYESLNFFSNIDVLEEEPEVKEEYFSLEIKLNDDVFIQRIFPAHVYHPKARYSVDIRPEIREILSDLTDVLSYTEYQDTYLGNKL